MGRHKSTVRIPFRHSAMQTNSSEDARVHIGRKWSDIPRMSISTFQKKKPESKASWQVSDKSGKQAKTTEPIPSKSAINAFTQKSTLRANNMSISDLPSHEISFSDRKMAGSHMRTEPLLQKRTAAPEFMSILERKEKIARHKRVDGLARQKIRQNSAQSTSRLPQATTLQFLRALLEKPLTFLDVHVLFGVSKRTTEGLVRNGFLEEVWGSDAVGVMFRLTQKGKARLRQLESFARFEPRTKEKGLVRLKHRA